MLNTHFSVNGRWSSVFLWLYWVVMLAIFIAGWIIRFSLPSLPIMDPDTKAYLFPSIHLFATGTYVFTYRTFLYPSFLTFILWIFPHLDSIAFIQHIIGLVTAAFIVLIFFRSRIFLPPGIILDWTTRLIALLSAYLYLFTRSPITLEHSIRPEALFPTACALTILIGLEFSRRVFLARRTDLLSSIWAFALVILALGTYYLKPAWGLAVGTSLLPLVLAWIWIPGQWRWKFTMPCIGTLLALIVFVLPKQLFPKDEETSFLAELLLCSHAEFLSDIIQRDALLLPPESQERAHWLRFVQDIHSAKIQPSRHRYGLSLNPDDLMYRGPLTRLKKGLQKCGISLSRYCYYYYSRAWLEHPFAMLKKVLLQLEFFFTPRKVNVYQRGTDIFLEEKYERIPEMLNDCAYPHWQPLIDYKNSLETQILVQKEFPRLPYGMQWLVLLFNNTFFLLLILSVVGTGIIFWKGSSYAHLMPTALYSLYLASFNIGNCLTIAFAHMMAVERYHFNQIAMSLVSQGFEFLFLIALIQTYLKSLKPVPVALQRKNF